MFTPNNQLVCGTNIPVSISSWLANPVVQLLETGGNSMNPLLNILHTISYMHYDFLVMRQGMLLPRFMLLYISQWRLKHSQNRKRNIVLREAPPNGYSFKNIPVAQCESAHHSHRTGSSCDLYSVFNILNWVKLLLLVKHETTMSIFQQSRLKGKEFVQWSIAFPSDYCRIFWDLDNEFDLANVVDVKPLSFGCIDGQNHLWTFVMQCYAGFTLWKHSC